MEPAELVPTLDDLAAALEPYPGSVGEGPDGHVVDRYILTCRQQRHRYSLYLDM